MTSRYGNSNLIAKTHSLLQVRKIVDALLCRLNAAKEERNRAKAIGTVAPVKRIDPNSKDLENTNLSAETRGHNRFGRSDQQVGPNRGDRPQSGGKS